MHKKKGVNLAHCVLRFHYDPTSNKRERPTPRLGRERLPAYSRSFEFSGLQNGE